MYSSCIVYLSLSLSVLLEIKPALNLPEHKMYVLYSDIASQKIFEYILKFSPSMHLGEEFAMVELQRQKRDLGLRDKCLWSPLITANQGIKIIS
jgi:hypothetical protein